MTETKNIKLKPKDEEKIFSAFFVIAAGIPSQELKTSVAGGFLFFKRG